MSTDLVRLLTPEERELARKQAELAALEARLAERELEFATLQAELGSFERRYLAIVGARYADLDEIEARIAEILARQSPHDFVAGERAQRARTQAQDSAQATGGVREQPIPARFIAAESLRSLYRTVAKAVHPDLAGDAAQRARREKLMAQANLAYERGDENALRAVLQDWELSPESVAGDGIGAELVRLIRKITAAEDRLSGIDAEVEQLRDSELHEVMARTEAAEAGGRDLLAEMAAQVDADIAAARQRLEELTRGTRRCER